MASRIFTVPNQLTFLRLGFLPFFIISIHYRRYDIALGVLIIAGLTDALDGLLARSLNQKTALGAYLDPIADKLLLSSSYVLLALNRKISWWLATLVLSRDIILLTSAAVILVVSGYRSFPPSIYGKLTTALQILLVFACCVAGRDELAVAEVWNHDHRLPGRGIYGLLRVSLLLHSCPPSPRARRVISRSTGFSLCAFRFCKS